MSRVDECKTNLLIKAAPPVEGYTQIVKRGEMGLKHLEFGILRLDSGEWSGETGECEQALDIHSGAISIETSFDKFQRIGSRKDIFDGLPTAVYLPPGTDYRITAEDGPVEIAIFSASAPGFKGEPAVIRSESAIVESEGRSHWQREVRTSIGDDFPAAKLLVGETVVTGHWSEYPPHKHDAFNPPGEFLLEEVCYFRVTPEQGFGLMRIYTGPNDPGPMDEVYVVEDGDTVVIPRGYHPVSAAPGYALHYTWAMAGDIRKPGAVSYDPRHAWMEE